MTSQQAPKVIALQSMLPGMVLRLLTAVSMSLAQYKINGTFATPDNEIKAHFWNRQLKKQVTSRMPLTGGLNEWQSFSYLSSSYIGASYTYKPVTYKNRTALINSRVTIATQWIP